MSIHEIGSYGRDRSGQAAWGLSMGYEPIAYDEDQLMRLDRDTQTPVPLDSSQFANHVPYGFPVGVYGVCHGQHSLLPLPGAPAQSLITMDAFGQVVGVTCQRPVSHNSMVHLSQDPSQATISGYASARALPFAEMEHLPNRVSDPCVDYSRRSSAESVWTSEPSQTLYRSTVLPNHAIATGINSHESNFWNQGPILDGQPLPLCIQYGLSRPDDRPLYRSETLREYTSGVTDSIDSDLACSTLHGVHAQENMSSCSPPLQDPSEASQDEYSYYIKNGFPHMVDQFQVYEQATTHPSTTIIPSSGQIQFSRSGSREVMNSIQEDEQVLGNSVAPGMKQVLSPSAKERFVPASYGYQQNAYEGVMLNKGKRYHLYQGGLCLPAEVDGKPVNPLWGLTKAQVPRKRVAFACNKCRMKKIRCDPGVGGCLPCRKACRRCPG